MGSSSVGRIPQSLPFRGDVPGKSDFTHGLHEASAFSHGHRSQSMGEDNINKVWFQFRDTALTNAESYDARLSYVHRNAVHHGIVREPSLYPWCSAGWFQRRAPTSLYKRIMALKY